MVEGTTPVVAGGVEAWRLSPRLGQRCQQGQVPAVVLGDLTLVRPVGWAGIPVVAVSPQEDDVAFRSRYVDGWCVVPGYLPPHDRATVRRLDQLGAALQLLADGVRIPLIYGSDAQLELLYRHREALERRFLFLLNQEDLGWALNDKGHFLALCQKAGVPVPRTFIPGFTRGAGGAAGDLDALSPPLVVKPRTKSDWKDIQQALFQSKAKARVFPDASSLRAHPGFAGVQDRLVVQEYIEAPVTNLRSFHGFADAGGQLLAWFSGHKLHTWPPVAGESALLQLDHDREVEDLGKETAERLELRGPFKLDLIRNPRDGRLYVLEVNARFNLWHHLGAAHGVNLPAVAHDYLVHGRVPLRPPEYQPRVRWQNVYRDLKALRDLGPAGVAPSLWTLFRPTVHELFAWRDPAPFLAQLSAMAGRYLPRRRRWPATV
jgi:D-aspartate ligase